MAQKIKIKIDIEVNSCNPGAWKVQAEVQSHPYLHGKFWASLDYMRAY